MIYPLSGVIMSMAKPGNPSTNISWVFNWTFIEKNGGLSSHGEPWRVLLGFFLIPLGETGKNFIWYLPTETSLVTTVNESIVLVVISPQYVWVVNN